MTNLRHFNRTLDQELLAVLRGASLECLVCGEFLLHGQTGEISCPECSSRLDAAAGSAAVTETAAG